MDEIANSPDFVTLEAPTPISTEVSDVDLVGRVRDGDELAFEELFNRHRRRVALIAGRFFQQREPIEEVVQESFTKAYFALESFSNTQEASFAAWLARITFNVCYDELRRQKRRPESSLSELSMEEVGWIERNWGVADASTDVAATLASRDLATKLLARLSPEDRLVLTLLDVEELSVAEIAKVTAWSASKVKVRAHRARTSLRKVIGKFL